jgi:hypothetical protein
MKDSTVIRSPRAKGRAIQLVLTWMGSKATNRAATRAISLPNGRRTRKKTAAMHATPATSDGSRTAQAATGSAWMIAQRRPWYSGTGSRTPNGITERLLTSPRLATGTSGSSAVGVVPASRPLRSATAASVVNSSISKAAPW